MKKILGLMLAVSIATLMGVSAMAADFVCPNGYTACTQNGECISSSACVKKDGTPYRGKGHYKTSNGKGNHYGNNNARGNNGNANKNNNSNNNLSDNENGNTNKNNASDNKR